MIIGLQRYRLFRKCKIISTLFSGKVKKIIPIVDSFLHENTLKKLINQHKAGKYGFGFRVWILTPLF
jgi:hypothetical protein